MPDLPPVSANAYRALTQNIDPSKDEQTTISLRGSDPDPTDAVAGAGHDDSGAADDAAVRPLETGRTHFQRFLDWAVAPILGAIRTVTAGNLAIGKTYIREKLRDRAQGYQKAYDAVERSLRKDLGDDFAAEMNNNFQHCRSTRLHKGRIEGGMRLGHKLDIDQFVKDYVSTVNRSITSVNDLGKDVARLQSPVIEEDTPDQISALLEKSKPGGAYAGLVSDDQRRDLMLAQSKLMRANAGEQMDEASPVYLDSFAANALRDDASEILDRVLSEIAGQNRDGFMATAKSDALRLASENQSHRTAIDEDYV